MQQRRDVTYTAAALRLTDTLDHAVAVLSGELLCLVDADDLRLVLDAFTSEGTAVPSAPT